MLAFLARVLDHVPEPRQQQVSYWGWYSNAARGKRRKIEPSPPSARGERRPTASQRRLSWAQLIKKVYEIDPLLFPYCRAEMRIVAFIVDLPSLRRLLRSLDLGPQLAQPLPRAPPTATELLYEAIDG